MRRLLLAFGITLCVSAGAAAQIHPANSALMSASPSLAPALPGGGGGGGDVFWNRSADEPSLFQANIEYAWTRFEGLPGSGLNLNGFTGGVTWFIFKQVGVEGQLLGEVGNPNGVWTKEAFVGGGPHFRLPEFGGRYQPWGHVLVGYSHFLPQTIYGGQGAFGWEAGGGVDIRMLSWLSWRVGADALGSSLFNTYQVNPIVHGGIVLNF